MSILLRLCFSLLLLAPALAHAATLENPANGSFYSGIGVISGWKCTANGPLTVRFNGGDPIPLAYGNERADVRNAGACPSAQVGFVSIMNWAELGDGTHTAVAYDNGVEFARSTFEVTTLGTPFLQGTSREVDVFDFPELGTDVMLKWHPALQNFVITDVEYRSGGVRVYWTDQYQNDLLWLDLNEPGSVREIVQPVRDHNITTVDDILADVEDGKLYIAISTTAAPYTHAFYRTNLDGTQPEVIRPHSPPASSSDLADLDYYINSMAMNSARDQIYYTAYFSGSYRLFRFNLHTKQEEKVSFEGVDFSQTGGGPSSVTVKGSTLYFTAMGVYTATTAGDDVKNLYRGIRNNDTGLGVTVEGGKIYWQMWPYTGNREGIYRMNLDGSDVEHFVDESYISDFDIKRDTLYYCVTNGSPYSIRLDGTEKMALPVSTCDNIQVVP